MCCAWLGTFCPLAVLWAEVKSGGQLHGQKAKGKETYYQTQANSEESKPKKWSTPKLEVFGPVVLESGEH
jgi:hypothetical protein